MAFSPPGEGWIEGPMFPPDLAKGPIEIIHYLVAQVGKEDSEQVWHRYIEQEPNPTEPGYYADQDGIVSHWDGEGWGVSPDRKHHYAQPAAGTKLIRLVPETAVQNSYHAGYVAASLDVQRRDLATVQGHVPVKRMVGRRTFEECAKCHQPWPCTSMVRGES